MAIIKGTLKDAQGNILYPRTSADKVMVDDSRTLFDIVFGDNENSHEYILTDTERIAGKFSNATIKDVDITRLTYFDIKFPELENDTWTELLDVTELGIYQLIRVYGTLFDTESNQIAIDTNSGLFFALDSTKTKLMVLTIDNSFEINNVYIVLEYIKFDSIVKEKDLFPESVGNLTVTQTTYCLASEEDGDPVYLTTDDLTIDENCTLTVCNRCKGLYIHVKGDLTVNGTISMTARGAKGSGRYVIIDHKKCTVSIQPEALNEIDLENSDKTKTLISPMGGEIYTEGFGSNPGTNGACGSGGSSNATYVGGYGTSFSGGAGSGGSGVSNITAPTSATNPAGQGGYGGAGHGSQASYIAYSGVGAGNPGGLNHNRQAVAGTDGTGGLLIIFVDGDIIIGDNGKIISSGVAGSYAYRATTLAGGYGRGGAGSGGGAVHIIHKGVFSKQDKLKVTAPGGAGGLSYNTNAGSAVISSYVGASGGDGTVNIIHVDDNGYPIIDVEPEEPEEDNND